MSRQYTLQRAPVSTSVHIDYAAELNEQQLAAVTAPPGPILVIAGAGSGKTRTLTYRVAYLLENGIDPRNILLLTFTNKAAREMLNRVANLLPVDASGLWGGTFHSVGNRILRRHGTALGYSSGFTIMITDLLARKYRFNVPGTRANLNWTRRIQRSITKLRSSRKERNRTQLIHELLEKTGRV